MFDPTVKFTDEYSEEELNFLEVNAKWIDRKLKTDLVIKAAYTHQFLNPFSCHPCHYKKGIPYS